MTNRLVALRVHVSSLAHLLRGTRAADGLYVRFLLDIVMLEKLAALFRIKTRHVEEYVPREVRVAQRLQDNVTSAETLGGLSPEEVTDAIAVVAELRQDTAVILNWPHEIESALGKLWHQAVTPRQFLLEKAESIRRASDSGILFSRGPLGGPPNWRFVLSDKFIRSIEKADKKLQGRILEAITKIAEAPTTPVGDPVKPLSANLRGLWRYRIGDYRLVYDPNPEEKHVTLLWFDNSGEKGSDPNGTTLRVQHVVFPVA